MKAVDSTTQTISGGFPSTTASRRREPMAAPAVTVCLRRGRLFVISSYAPGPGTYIDKEPVAEVPAQNSCQIGTKVRAFLRCFIDSGTMPDWKTYRSPVLRA